MNDSFEKIIELEKRIQELSRENKQLKRSLARCERLAQQVDKIAKANEQVNITLYQENVQLYKELEDSFQSLDKAKKAAEAYSMALDAELEKGRQIQRDFLPDQFPQLPNWEIQSCFLPATQVSGDFYDVFSLPGNNIGLVAADVCDKGVGSALFMALLRSLIRIFSGQTHLTGYSIETGEIEKTEQINRLKTVDINQSYPLKAIELANMYVDQNHSHMGMFATIFFGVLNPENGLLAYINGGHEPPYIISSEGIKKNLKPTGPAVGLTAESQFKIQKVYLDPGDILISYTDGVTEACTLEGELFTKKRLQSLLEEPIDSASEAIERIKNNLMDFIDRTPQSDDITILSLRRLPNKFHSIP